MVDPALVEEFQRLVCVPGRHTHGHSRKALLMCGMNYLAENPDET